MDKYISEKNTFRITFDEKKDNVKARIENTMIDEKGNKTKSTLNCEGIDNVNESLIQFLAHVGSNLKRLVEIDKIIKMDDATALRYEFDYENMKLVRKRLSRSLLRSLEGNPYEEENSVVHEEKTVVPEEKTAVVEEKKEEVVPSIVESSEEVVDDTEDLVEEETSEEVEDISKSKDFDEIAKQIIKLNPKATIRLEKKGLENRKIYTDVPGESLVLPEGFLYNKLAILTL